MSDVISHTGKLVYSNMALNQTHRYNLSTSIENRATALTERNSPISSMDRVTMEEITCILVRISFRDVINVDSLCYDISS